MSFFKRLFTSEVTVRPSTDDEEKIRQLHLSATENIRGGDLTTGINELREAQEMMPVVALEYPIKQYLRLPATLQKAGQFQEAVVEFNRLLEASEKPYQKSNIYDKFRLACQREGRHAEAIDYGLLCSAWECIALDEQNRDSSAFVKEPERWLKPIRKSLKALDKESSSDAIAKLCVSYARQPSDMAASMLVLEVRDVLQA